MNRTSLLVLAGSVAAATASGWWAREAWAPDQGAVTAAAPVPAVAAPPAPAPSGPTIIVGTDGLATLHVDQQPLAWVIERIAQQAGWPELLERAAAAQAAASRPPAAAVATAPVEGTADGGGPTPQRARAVLAAMQRGTEPERWQALIDARTESIAVSDEQLRHVYETDASDRVRLEALASAVYLRDGDPDAQRRVLEVSQYVPNAAVQAESRRRLAELDESRRIHEQVMAMRQLAREQRQAAATATVQAPPPTPTPGQQLPQAQSPQ